MGLNCIYWCINPANQRAVRFYDKSGYCRVDSIILKIGEQC